MAIGPGKYDEKCIAILKETTDAELVLLCVIGRGPDSSGFSVTTRSPTTIVILPHVLRDLADSIESDTKSIISHGPAS